MKFIFFLLFTFIFSSHSELVAGGNPFSKGYRQDSNPFGKGYIQDTNPFGKGYYQSTNPFGKGYIQEIIDNALYQKMLIIGIIPSCLHENFIFDHKMSTSVKKYLHFMWNGF